MGFAKKRVGKGGKPRYTAVYVDLRGSERSAGTFASERAADRAWQKAEVELRQGRIGDPARGRQTFEKYVEERWLPNHVLEPTTREKYTYYLGAHIFPELGPMRMTDIFPEHIREWISRMQREGQSAWTIQYCKSSILNSIFTTALTVDVRCGLGEVIDLLEDCYYGDLSIGGTPVEQHARATAAQLGAEGGSESGFLSERHQIVFSSTPAAEDSEDLIQRLIYRADLPYRKDYSAIRYPAELNRRPGWLVAVGPYVSVVCGQQNYVENAIFASAVHGIGAAAQLRAIRQAAYADVQQFRRVQGAPETTRDRRRELEGIADRLGDLELELSYSVEASADLGLLVPSLRAESFHNMLYESIGLAGKAATTERMLERLGAAISAELTAIESIERRADDNRRVRYAVAVGFVSAVAIPASLILTFLGINASQVKPDRSMFSAHYLGMYIAVAALIVIGVVLSLGLWMQDRRDARHQHASTSRPHWMAAPDQPHS
jgi:Phage integrase, N-terminal SAM-like domain